MSSATAATQALAAPSPPAPSAIVPPPDHPPWRMPLALYERIVEAGLLNEYRHVYLWEGRLCERMGIDRPHVLGVKGIYDFVRDLRPEGYDAETETPMAFRFAASAPQPDVKVIRGRSRDFQIKMPTTADVALVVEVTDSTLSKDRALAARYATEEIPVYWLLNIEGRRLEVYADPVAGVYTTITFFGPDDEAPVVLDGREVGRVRVGEFLP